MLGKRDASARFNANQIGASNFCCCFWDGSNSQTSLDAVIRQRGDGAGVSVEGAAEPQVLLG